MNTEEKLQVLAAMLEENCSAVRIKDGCMLFQGKKALFGILLLKTIYRDDDNKITSFRMQWLEKGAVDGPEADVAMAQNRLIENLQSAFPQMLVENPARVKQCVRIALQVQLNHYKQLEASEGVFITKPGWHTDRNDELVYYVGPIRYAVHTETVGMADSLKKYRVPERATAIAQQQECDIIMELAKIPCPPLHMAFLFQIAAIIKPLMERAGIIDRNPILYLYGEAGSGKTRLLRLVNSLYLRNDGDREIFEIPLRSWKNSLYGGMQEASGTVVILDDLAGSNGVQSEQDAKKLKELIMALGNGALPLRGTEGKESRVDFLAAVTANSILDYTLEILERICIVCVGQGDIPFERIQQIIGSDPSPLAGIYLQLIRHIVSKQDGLVRSIQKASLRFTRPAELYRMHGNYQVFRYAVVVIVDYMRTHRMSNVDFFIHAMEESIQRCEQAQREAILTKKSRAQEKAAPEEYDQKVIRQLKLEPNLLAQSPREYRNGKGYIGYIDLKNQRVCLKVKALCRKFPPGSPNMPEGSQERKACRLFKKNPWLICGDTRTIVHGVDDKRFLALKAEAFGLRCEL